MNYAYKDYPSIIKNEGWNGFAKLTPSKTTQKEETKVGICTAAQAVEAMKYWDGYYEKASSKYVTYRDKQYFAMDKGSANYTYMGYLCGIQGGAWCAMTVSTAIYEACGKDKTSAKKVMHGVWPYAACNQMWDAAPSAYKGKRGKWTPIPGDVIIFSKDGVTREHTGMVIGVNGNIIYVQEGNKSNMCKVCTYYLTDSYIYGYVRPLYSDANSGATSWTYLAKGDTGSAVKELQENLLKLGYDLGGYAADGVFGDYTDKAVRKFQADHGLVVDGQAGQKTLAAIKEALKNLPTTATNTSTSTTSTNVNVKNYPVIKKGSKNNYVIILQKRLKELGYAIGVDGVFGGATNAAVRKFQADHGLVVDGIVGKNTWAALFA